MKQVLYGLGNDIEDISRVAKLFEKLPAYATKILTPAELEIFSNLSKRRKLEYLAGRYSAKESYSKALGTGIGKSVSFQDLEILNDELNAPYFAKHPLEDKCHALISISHTKDHVFTTVILDKIN